MYTTLITLLLIISETNCLYVQNTTFNEDAEGQNLHSRKLQDLQEHDSRNETKVTPWSEILADIVINKVFSFNKRNNEKEMKKTEENVLVKSVGLVLKLYKTYIFDKFRHDQYLSDSNNTDINRVAEMNITKAINSPKDEVEIIEPKYHGKLCVDCKGSDPPDIEVKTVSDCADGLKKDKDGKCVSSNPAKFILSIPWQCPNGYKRDWLGYCRVSL